MKTLLDIENCPKSSFGKMMIDERVKRVQSQCPVLADKNKKPQFTGKIALQTATINRLLIPLWRQGGFTFLKAGHHSRPLR